MRVDRVRVAHMQVGYRKPIFVEITCEDGRVGWGEAGVAYGVGGAATAQLVMELAARFVIGSEPRQCAATVRAMTELSFWGKSGGQIFTAAVSGLEHALLDLVGKELDAPIHVLLGGAEYVDVPVYANGWWFGCSTIEEYAEAAAQCVADGHVGLKFYPLAVPDERTVIRHPERRAVDRDTYRWGVDTIAAVREAAGPDAAIMLDIGGGIATDTAVRFCQDIERYDIDFVEETLDPSVRRALRHVTGKTTITVAAGERHLGRSGVVDLLDEGVLLLQPDVANCGGIRELRYIAAMAETFGARVSPHNYGGSIATAAALQVSATLPNLHTLEYFPYFDEEPDYVEILATPFQPGGEPGTVQVPTGPGLGIDIRSDIIEDYVVGEVTDR